MATYKTPGVYTEEISLLPPSVAEVATAIPAFVGYTDWAVYKDQDWRFKPTRITSLLEYRSIFGGPPVSSFEVDLKSNDQEAYEIESIKVSDVIDPPYLLYYSLNYYFSNGGGPCYIVSTGEYKRKPEDKALDKDAFLQGLDALKKEDEPTLILLTDAVNLAPADYYTVCQAALQQCSTLGDRFSIFDVLPSDDNQRGSIGEGFRNAINGDLKFAAAYYPYLQTSINNYYTEDKVLISGFVDKTGELYFGSLRIEYNGSTTIKPKVEIKLTGDPGSAPAFVYNNDTNVLTITLKKDGDAVENIVAAWRTNGVNEFINLYKTTFISSVIAGAKPVPYKVSDLSITSSTKTDQAEVVMDGSTISFSLNDDLTVLTVTIPKDGCLVEDIVSEWKKFNKPKGKFSIQQVDSKPQITEALNAQEFTYYTGTGGQFNMSHPAIRLESTVLHSQIQTELGKQRVKLPPSPAVAGVYARVDRTRGVWNAPANEALMATIKPMVKITNDEQDRLNIDTNAGKSINAIRDFVGKGVLIWGARTLAGNDNEWRYIPVRRLFIMIEESVKKSTAWAVFGPNNAMAWLKVKAMIESYLEGLWRQGALVGAKPEQAFFVRVGLGSTMTNQDILEGRMIVEIGLAAVRPAEFIILRFSHKMQEA
ncbi:MAG: phage tail sheath family protein [Dehalococcoidales bacterium]|nr:phage tail sheath family protein [Dehalococcoidales bacterium]